MEDVQARLKESADACLKSYEEWTSKEGSAETRENLQESIHELRKVASRLEIEIAISERKKVTSKPLPIPPHRSQSKHKGNVESILPDNGNTDPDGQKSDKKNNGGSRKSRPRRPAPRKSD